jgi:hypothetical protein
VILNLANGPKQMPPPFISKLWAEWLATEH